MRIQSILLSLICIVAILFASDNKKADSDFNMHFRATGLFSIGAHLYGKPKYGDLGPGYRSDMMINMELISYKDLTFDFLTAASTSIARLPDDPIQMDKIRYKLTPTFRYSLTKVSLPLRSIIYASYHQSPGDEKGSTWWNAVQAGWGTKGAYSFYFIQNTTTGIFRFRTPST